MAERLHNKEITAIYTSSHHRATETAMEINRWHNLPLHKIPELEEQDLGILAGHKRNDLSAELEATYKRSRKNPDYRIPGGESFNDLVQRLRPIIEKIVKIEGNVLVVAHGRVTKAIIHILTGKTFPEVMAMTIPNGGLVEIDVLNGKGHIIHADETSSA